MAKARSDGRAKDEDGFVSSVGRNSAPPASLEPEIQAVSRAAQILRLFGLGSSDLTAAEVAERLGLNRTTAYRYCTSLVAAGLLERGHRAGSFIPGGLLLQLGVFALGRRRVVDLAPAHLRRLCAATHHTAVMSLWGGTGAVVSRVEEEPAPVVVVTVRVGTQLALGAAQSKVFLAWHPDQLMVSRYLANYPVGERTAFEDDVAAVRARGFATYTEVPGILAIAAPVFDEYGVCAALALVGTEVSLSARDDSSHLAALLTTARELTEELGGRQPHSEQLATF
ncbi:IclR family transcriptional regulator [Micromonospora sp. ATA32]|nr:IclR family transcriptional regulator [Micromonospora sp. ATA32]